MSNGTSGAKVVKSSALSTTDAVVVRAVRAGFAGCRELDPVEGKLAHACLQRAWAAGDVRSCREWLGTIAFLLEGGSNVAESARKACLEAAAKIEGLS